MNMIQNLKAFISGVLSYRSPYWRCYPTRGSQIAYNRGRRMAQRLTLRSYG